MVDLRTREGMGARALELAILTAARSGMVRGATWAEFDLQAKVWTVPAARMKGLRGKSQEHRIPLSTPALDLLEALPRIAGTDLVFPASRGGQLSDATMAAVIDRMNEGEGAPAWVDKDRAPVVPHGFRSTFRDWAGERTNFPRELAEQALAHVLKDKTEAAYARGDALEKRAKLMAAWGNYLARIEERKPANVVQFGRT
jgi:integrase